MIEIWKDISNYKGYYQASNIGRIKSLDRYVRGRYNTMRLIKGKVLKPGITNKGYFAVNIYRIGNHRMLSVHRLVAVTFINNPENKATVNHKNGNKLDNRVENLEFMTQKENVNHAYNKGLHNYNRRKILMLSLDNEPLLWFNSLTEASTMSGVNLSSVSNCCVGSRKTAGRYKWQHYAN